MAEAMASELADVGAQLRPSRLPFTPPQEEVRDFANAAFEPLLVVAGAIAIGSLLDRIVAAVHNLRHGGAVVDIRGDKLHIHTNPVLPPGMVVGVTDEGIQVIEKAERAPLARLIAEPRRATES